MANLQDVKTQISEMPKVSLGRDLVKLVNTIKAGDEILKTAFDAKQKGGKQHSN